MVKFLKKNFLFLAPMAGFSNSACRLICREYGADESAGRITRNPMALASALRKLEDGCSRDTNTFRDSSSANLWIVNPFGRFRKKMLCSLMDTHPSTDDRIKRLMKLDEELSSPTNHSK